MEQNARHLFDRGDLRPDITLAQARDVMLVYSSLELYELWCSARAGRWIDSATSWRRA